jgi:hypothetical protein
LQAEIGKVADYSEIYELSGQTSIHRWEKITIERSGIFYISRGGASEAGRFYLLFSAL